MRLKVLKWLTLIFAVVVVAIVIGYFIRMVRTPRWQKVLLTDGRTLQIEAVTKGKFHQIGQKTEFQDRYLYWMPGPLHSFLRPKYGSCSFSTDHDSLVIWINALDSKGEHVDAQSLRVEILAANGENFPTSTSACFLGAVCRVGHVFPVFPRNEKEFQLRFTPWKTKKPTTVTFRNPFFSQAADLVGKPVPQTNSSADLQIVLTRLELATNGSSANYWESPVAYWQPYFEMYQNGKIAIDWTEPEWIGEDNLGNRGKYLGISKSALKFEVLVYPHPTNFSHAKVVSVLPKVRLKGLTNNLSLNLTNSFGSNEIVSIGILPAGTHVFCDGQLTNVTGFAPVTGGSPSGWVSTSRRISSEKLLEFSAHFTPVHTLYLRASFLGATNNMEVRLRDGNNQYFVAKREPQGRQRDVRPYLFELPDDVDEVTPEIVIVTAVKAGFTVQTPRVTKAEPANP
jgi:hypothetical protein